MKLIDRQGKIFGIINILDLFLILILLGAGAFALVKFTKTDNIVIGSVEKKEITYTLYNSSEQSFVTDRIKVGTVLRDAGNNAVIGEIVDLKKEPAAGYVTTADGRYVLAEIPDKFAVYITVKANATMSTPPVVGGNQMLVGTRIGVKGPDFRIDTLISDINLGEQ